jgi:hypothetical protein
MPFEYRVCAKVSRLDNFSCRSLFGVFCAFSRLLSSVLGEVFADTLTRPFAVSQYRAGGIRTHDLLNPIQAHYQAVLRPDLFQERQRCQGQRALQPKRVHRSRFTVRGCVSFEVVDEF